MSAASSAVVAAAVFAASASAALYTSEYSYNGPSAASGLIDPVGLVFVGPNADAQEVRVSISKVMDWGNGETSSDQYYKADGVWKEMQAQNSSGCAFCTRDHIRLGTAPQQKYLRDGWKDYTIGTPHHDQKSIALGCVFPKPYGHVARNFNGVRDSIALQYVGRGRDVTTVFWGNKSLARQCDGSLVGSADGNVKYIWTL